MSGKSTIILWAKFTGALPEYAAVVESADTRDLKSLAGNSVPVQVGSAAPSTSCRRAARSTPKSPWIPLKGIHFRFAKTGQLGTYLQNMVPVR